MITPKTRLYAAVAAGVLLAAVAGYGIARLTETQVVASAEETEPAPDTVKITDAGIRTSAITVATVNAGEISAAIPASATVDAAPDADAVLTARAAGTVTRIFKRLGDPVRAGETIALVESRDASSIAADRSAAAARVTLASRRVARERSLVSQGVSARADLETAQAELVVAHADARRASAAAGAARVTGDGQSVAVVSPIGGRVTAVTGNLGSFVSAETELFRVADPTRLQITASLPPADAARIRTGDRAELTTNDGLTVAGRIRSATGVVDPNSRQATVVISPSAGTSMLVPGQLVSARIFASGGSSRTGLTVPQDAVQTIGDRTVVFVRVPGGFRAQTVETGLRSGGLVEIRSGIRSGTAIATVNAFLLKAELLKESAE
jgi:cobalt-zinc-cadmium efflux system membrane fusion protein